MHIAQLTWNAANGWQQTANSSAVASPQVVLYFAGPGMVAQSQCYTELQNRYPDAHVIGCTTGGEIVADDVFDDSVVATAIEFDNTRVKVASINIEDCGSSQDCGERLGKEMLADDLATVFVLSDGILVNGSELIGGMLDVVGRDIPVTGGLAGDGDKFATTYVGADCEPIPGQVVALGLYGDAISVGHGSVGGWDVFGPERTITRSDDNVLFELDGEPALELYKNYLGDEADNLPGSGLLFPLKVRPADAPDKDVVRTIVGVDDESQSLIFAGNVPEGYVAQLMRGNFDHLIEGAASAARAAMTKANGGDNLAIMISCVGRKLLMGQRIGEEVEAAGECFGANTMRTGFYSYGEISPHAESGVSDLHNQTMTVTVLSES